MIKAALSIGLLALTALEINGCDPKPAEPIPTTEQPFARFLPYPQAIGLALDTKTGLLCHTFNENIDTYVPTGRSHTPGVTVGQDIVIGHQSLDSAPLCVDLSQEEEQTVDAAVFANEDYRELSGEKPVYYERDPDGQIHQFDSKEQAETFKRSVARILERNNGHSSR